jgi:hypothetical protein
MALVMLMHWPEVSKQQYEQVRKEINWEAKVPKGAKFHAAWFADDGLHVMDLWQSQADWDAFFAGQLGPAVKNAKIQGQPNVQYGKTHSIFAPNVKTGD